MSQATRFVPSSLNHRPHAATSGPPRILIFGGSQGAHAINMAMVEAAPRLAARPGGMAITHQTGERDLELVRDGYRRAGLEARVEPFLFAMDREMKDADLVVCRAGATTLAELTAAGGRRCSCRCRRRPTITSGKNAEVLVAGGAAEMIEQKDMTGETLAGRIIALVGDDGRRGTRCRPRRGASRGRTRRGRSSIACSSCVRGGR